MPYTKYFACFNPFIQHDKALKILLFILSFYKTEKQAKVSALLQVTFKHKQSDPSEIAKVADGWMATTSFVY